MRTRIKDICILKINGDVFEYWFWENHKREIKMSSFFSLDYRYFNATSFLSKYRNNIVIDPLEPKTLKRLEKLERIEAL